MADFKDKEALSGNGRKNDSGNQVTDDRDDIFEEDTLNITPEQENGVEAVTEREEALERIVEEAFGGDVQDYLDDDLADDFIKDEDNEKFLNEIGISDDGSLDILKNDNAEADFDHVLKEDLKENIQKIIGNEGGCSGEMVMKDGQEKRSRKRDASGRGYRDVAGPAEEDNVGKEPQAFGKTAEKRPEPEAVKNGGKKKKGFLIAACAALGALVLCTGAYVGIAGKYRNVFFPNTRINGLDVSGKTVEQVKEMIAAGTSGYVLEIRERDDRTETVTGEEMKLRPEFDGSLERMMAEQKPFTWPAHQMNSSSYQLETMIVYEDEAFKAALSGLDCMNESLMVKPENAKISEYVTGSGYTVVPEVLGSTVVPEIVEKTVSEAVSGLRETISLEEAGAYEAPAVKKEDEALNAHCDTLNRYAKVTITYQFGDGKEVLNGDRIHEWLVVNQDFSVTVDSEKALAFVDELALTYDTYNKAKTLKTSYGSTIQVAGGSYGWRINRAAELEALLGQIASGESVEREPVYSQKAASHSGNDYGNTYVEINLTAQHLFYYKDGSLVTESDFVSGNQAKGWGTPAGAYSLAYKQRNAVLKGENYRTPVSYWMPFNGGIGLHDANWRSSFGGTIYKTGGSHGCVNLPPSVAKKIYENITAGTPVLCYNLGGTESSGTSSVKPAKPAAPPAQTAPAPVESTPALPEVTIPQPVPQPTEAPQPAPETTAPAGPGSDQSLINGNGPGSVQ